MKRRHFRRAKRQQKSDWEMEIDEVSLSRDWTAKAISLGPAEVRIYLSRDGAVDAIIDLRQGELEDASAGFRALADVLDEARARGVDKPVPVKGPGMR